MSQPKVGVIVTSGFPDLCGKAKVVFFEGHDGQESALFINYLGMLLACCSGLEN